MLQGNAATGLLFLAGITWGSPIMGLAALLSACCGTAAAALLKYDGNAIAQGLYGFSAALVGVALVLLRGHGPLVWAAMVPGAVAAAILQHFFFVRKIPVFTLPFVLVTWVLLAALPTPAQAAAPAPLLPVLGGSYVAATVRGFGQVIFQERLLSGLLFMLGVAANSRIAAAFGVAGALLAVGWAWWWNAPGVDMGLWSFNAVLCTTAVAGTARRNFLLFLFSVPLSVAIGLALTACGMPQLTFPFVAATGLGLLTERLLQRARGSNLRPT